MSWNGLSWYWEQMANYWLNLLSRYTNPTPEQLQENFVKMLGQVDPTSELWFALDHILTDWGKVQAEIKQLDIGAYYNWFNQKIYPVIAANNGRFRHTDASYQSCSYIDLLEIIQHDFTKYKQYISEWWDCDDYSRLFQSRLASIYGINTCAVIETLTKEDPPRSHAFNAIVDNSGAVFMYEPQGGRLWHPDDSKIDEIYNISNIQLWLM